MSSSTANVATFPHLANTPSPRPNEPTREPIVNFHWEQVTDRRGHQRESRVPIPLSQVIALIRRSCGEVFYVEKGRLFYRDPRPGQRPYWIQRNTNLFGLIGMLTNNPPYIQPGIPFANQTEIRMGLKATLEREAANLEKWKDLL